MIGELGAIDSMLQQLAYYKRHDPNQQVSDGVDTIIYERPRIVLTK